MKRIAVILGTALDPAGMAVNRRRGRIFVNREEYLIHPADQRALEAALRLKDDTDAEVIALPRGPMADDDALRQALARGADRSIALEGESLASADAAAMSSLLAAALDRVGGVSMVLMGDTTLDSGQSQLAPRLAEALGWPQILSAWRVQAHGATARAVISEAGAFTEVSVALPTVVSMDQRAPRLRYPNGARLINAYREQGAVDRWQVDDLLDADTLSPITEVLGQDFPPERTRGTRLEGDVEQMAATAGEQLKSRLKGY